MRTFRLNKVMISVVTSTLLLGAFSGVNAAALTDGGSTAADSISGAGDTIDSGETHTLTGSSVTLGGSIEGLSDGVGSIIIDGDVLSGSNELGTSGNALGSLTVNSGKTLTLESGSNIYATSTVIGGELTVDDAAVTISGTIDGSSAGTGTLTINSGTGSGSFVHDGVIGGNNALDSINISSSSLYVKSNVSAGTINFIGAVSNEFAMGSNITVIGNFTTDNAGFGNIYNTSSNVTLKGKIGTSSKPIEQVYNSGTITLSGDVFNNPIHTQIFDNDGGTITIDASDSAIADGASVTLISTTNTLTAGTITGPTDTAMIDYTTTVYAGASGSVSISAAYSDASSLGLSDNDSALYTQAATVIGNNDALFSALNNATTSERSDILESLQPDGSFTAVIGGVQVTVAANGTISNHIALNRTNNNGGTGIATGDDSLNKKVWFQVFGNDVEQKDRGGISGYDADGYGFVLGIDNEINDASYYGLALAKGGSKVTGKGAGNAKTTIDSIQVSAYYSTQLADNYFADAIISYASNKNEGTRSIASTSIVANSDFDSQAYSTKATLGKAIKYNGHTFIPNASLNYVHFVTDSYTETGAGNLNLTVNTNSLNKYDAYLGTKVILAPYSMGNSALISPELSFGVTQEMGDSMSSTLSSFAGGGGSFTTNGLEAAKTSLDVGIGGTYYTSDKLTEIRLDYNLKAKSDYMAQSVMLTGKYKF